MHQLFLKTFLPVCLLITFLTAIPLTVQAAVVLLKNGDRVTGIIIKMQDKRLEIDTDSAGIIKIKWEDVQSITSERPMSIKLYGEADMPEDAGERRVDRLIVNTLGGEGAIPLEDVRAINFAENDYRGYLSAGGNQTSCNTKTQALNISGYLTYRDSNIATTSTENIIARKPTERTRLTTAPSTFSMTTFLHAESL